jgi:hypothetical protein
MNLIKMFLENQPPSYDNDKVEHITRKSKMYHLNDRILFQQGTNNMMMKYIFREEGIQLLQDIHSGVCESQSSLRSITGKVFRHIFYWPTTKDDVMEIILKYKDCRFFQKETTKHTNLLQPMDLS